MQKKIKALKYLGQNFLKSPQTANKIVALLGDIYNKDVIEIGPGMGALTTHIINNGAVLTCFDVDERSIKYLKEKFTDSPNLTIIHSDIRDIKLDKNVSIIGNIPYNITNDILFWMLDNVEYIGCAVLTIQREVAKRYTAKENTKDYGITTLILKLYGIAKICFNISATEFIPIPKVESSVLLIEFNASLYNELNKPALIKFIRAAFSQRRKMLSNSLERFFLDNNIDSQKISQQLLRIDKHYLKCRAEQLTLDDYIIFFNVICDNIYH